MQNNDKHICECKNAIKHCNCKKNYNWNLRTYICKNGKYLESIFDDSVITSDGIMNELCSESTKTMIINLNNKKATCKMDNCYIYIFALILTAILLLITVGVYYYYHYL